MLSCCEAGILSFSCAVAAILVCPSALCAAASCACRFDDIVGKMTPFLKQCGYNTKKGMGTAYEEACSSLASTTALLMVCPLWAR